MPQSGFIRLGVNIDHVATLRNARGGTHPDPVEAAKVAIAAGADGITAHLREDRRHITDADMERLAVLCEDENIPLNMELAATDEMVSVAMRLKPHAACIVPERREERTTEGGLDVAGQHNRLVPIIAQLADAGCCVSLFIEANPHQIEAAASTRANVVEFHTGAYAHALDDGDQTKADAILEQLREGGRLAHAAGLEVHYGHGLTFDNVAPIARINEAKELNIGHFIIGEAVFLGLQPAIERMATLIRDARAS
ncbi:pyridoxine 5'-phosphate synthase [Algimonas arctica]|uniref:Pyridoxine 5'-phosphate synthase n=1 Tax=Algimonas arctica TaxID=1479486 RepID=A0A8J3CSB7_9PROT|nr:pyridoxine 5'-phosphate synthase [Algimonas arctica]GHA91673.1 pyridoxine 5'-phosphate synthase [Algimonas arctica]